MIQIGTKTARLALLVAAPTLALACGSDSTESTATASTGGASAGGATSGGASSGGASTGGAATGGVGGAAGGAGGAGGAGATGTGVTPPLVGDCSTLQEGNNTGFTVNGVERSFILNLPSTVVTGGPWPVVFNWHGLGDSAANMNGLISGQVDNATMPFIAVTPEDGNYMLQVPVVGQQNLDWDVFKVTEDNTELAVFDGVLACLEERFGVDEERVHTMGFSLGSVLSDMIASQRSDVVASVATYSGGYWNNPENIAGLLGSQVTWPDFSPSRPFPQLFVHGGAGDSIAFAGLITLAWNEYAISDTAMLNTAGHDVVICDHGQGHTAPAPGMGMAELIQFFADHPKSATDSPYAQAGLPGSFADYCSFSEGS